MTCQLNNVAPGTTNRTLSMNGQTRAEKHVFEWESNMSLRGPQLLPRWLRWHRVPHPSCVLAGFARGQKLDPSAVQPSEFVMHEISPTWCMLHRTWEETKSNKEGPKRCGPLEGCFLRWTRRVYMIPQLCLTMWCSAIIFRLGVTYASDHLRSSENKTPFCLEYGWEMVRGSDRKHDVAHQHYTASLGLASTCIACTFSHVLHFFVDGMSYPSDMNRPTKVRAGSQSRQIEWFSILAFTAGFKMFQEVS